MNTPKKINYKGQTYRLVESEQLNEEYLYKLVDKFPSSYTFDAIKRLEFHTPEVEFDKEKVVNALTQLSNVLDSTYKIVYGEIIKPENDIKVAKEKARKQETGLIVNLTQAQADLIDSVLGQLSDGYWENSSYYDWIWKNCSVEGNKLIIDRDKMRFNRSYSDRGTKDFEALSEANSAKAWFARKAQIVQNADLKDHYGSTRLAGHEEDQAQYLDRGVNQTYGQIQDAIDSLI